MHLIKISSATDYWDEDEEHKGVRWRHLIDDRRPRYYYAIRRNLFFIFNDNNNDSFDVINI